MKNIFHKKNKNRDTYDYLEVLESPYSYTTESLQKMIVNLEYANVDKIYKAIQVASSLSGEGKTTLVGNMAILLSQRNHKVIVVDLDLRKPKIHRTFQVPNDIGVSNYLHGSATLEEIVKKDINGVDVIVSGEKTNSIASLLESEKLQGLINLLKEQYDYVLIDSPPIQVNADAVMISKIVDGVVFVISYNYAKKNVVRDAVNQLLRRKISIIGVTLTQVKITKRLSYNYYYYYADN